MKDTKMVFLDVILNIGHLTMPKIKTQNENTDLQLHHTLRKYLLLTWK